MSSKHSHVSDFKEDVRSWAVRVRVRPKQIRVQEMGRKWASCSLAGRVTFSRDLLKESHDFQTYVIVHELLHLKVPNHGRLFKSLLSSHLPDWKQLALNCCHVPAVRRSGS